MKKSIVLILFLSFFLNPLLGSPALCGETPEQQPEHQEEHKKDPPKPITHDHLDNTLSQAIEILKSNYYQDHALTEETEAWVLRGLLESLEEPYSRYVPPGVLWTEYVNNLESFGGLGVMIDFTDKGVTVFRTLGGSAAEKAGIAPGDIIEEVDGVVTHGLSKQELQGLFMGEIGTEVALKIKQPGDLESREVRLERSLVQHQSAEWEMHEGGIGELRILEFNDSTAAQVVSALQDLEQSGAHALLLDLRFNPGGLVWSAVNIADMFIDDGMIASIEKRDEKSPLTFYASKDKTLVHMPVLALVNGYTASASELLAGSLQHSGAATIAGSTTYGKALAQQPFPLHNGGVLWLTTGRVLIAGTLDINKIGVKPDIPLAEADEEEKQRKAIAEMSASERETRPDPVKDQALEYIKVNLLNAE